MDPDPLGLEQIQGGLMEISEKVPFPLECSQKLFHFSQQCE